MEHPIKPAAMPGIAAAESGQVTLDGPNGVAIAMTPEAAIETGRRLIAAGEIAARHEASDDDER